jgi:antitoxin component HigA of HigAB toxin-antitoxin module
MEKEFLILTDKDYHETMIAICELMNKGETHLTSAEIEQLKIMTWAAEKYEDKILHLKPAKQPVLSEVIELFMYQNKLSQANSRQAWCGQTQTITDTYRQASA